MNLFVLFPIFFGHKGNDKKMEQRIFRHRIRVFRHIRTFLNNLIRF